MTIRLKKFLSFLFDNIFWIVLALFVSVSIVKAFGAYWFVHHPIISGYFWNEGLKMYEPIYLSPRGGWWDVIKFISYSAVGGAWYLTALWFVSGFIVLERIRARFCIVF